MNWSLEESTGEKHVKFAKHKNDLVVLKATLELARKNPEQWLKHNGTNLPTNLTNNFIEVRFLDARNNVVEQLEHDDQLHRFGLPALPPDVWVTGLLTNQGSRNWVVERLEIRALDSRGELRDVDGGSPWSSLTVPSHHEVGFRVPVSSPKFTNLNNSIAVRVALAHEQ